MEGCRAERAGEALDAENAEDEKARASGDAPGKRGKEDDRSEAWEPREAAAGGGAGQRVGAK